MSPWREKLLGESRTSLLKLLRHAPQTVVELAESLGLSANGIRAHLAWLTAHGLVESAGSRRDTGGKPAQIYTITTGGEELFPKAYATALLGVLEEVGEHGAEPGKVRELMQAVGERFGDEVPVPTSQRGKVSSAVEAVRLMGGDLVAEDIPEGWRLSGHGCPLSAVVALKGETCELIRAMIARVSGCSVATCCHHGQQPNCCFELRRPTEREG